MGIFDRLFGKRKELERPARGTEAEERIIDNARQIEIMSDSINPEAITYDGSEDLRQASSLAERENTREEGLNKLSEFIKKYPDSSDPYVYLAWRLVDAHRIEDAEALLLEAYPKVLKKSNVADSLGSLYLNKRKDLLKAAEWYVKSVAAAGANPSDWHPYLYLSGIYRYYGLNHIASTLQSIANEVRKNPIDLTAGFYSDMATMNDRISADSVRSLLKLLNEEFMRAVSQAIKDFREKGKPPVKGSVYCPALKCSLCGDADVVFSFSDDHTHELCVKCQAIFCKRCRIKHGSGCPVCGANELSIDFIRNPPGK